ncbi:GIY-YIG nuclease family protein [uncultured Chitinophaga sp.]|uniref:GIY-YIG nuclease family protein n=1 Tax=uncultured Chitinophaga sp. TaxID=339340 RepID=UPI0025CD48D5|nr:GIY-YIG nuclease family protein [uncultured Chitinophaga sp.]
MNGKGGYVYIISNKARTVLYTGVTADLYARIIDHRDKKYHGSFTARYGAGVLLYYNFFSSIEEAIAEEKRIKGGSRQAKINLINEMNPEWRDLFPDVEEW